LFRQKSREDPPELKVDVERPETELGLEPLERRFRLMRDQDVNAEAFHPAVRTGAEAKGIGLLGDEILVQIRVDPFGHFHGWTREHEDSKRDSVVGLHLRPSL